MSGVRLEARTSRTPISYSDCTWISSSAFPTLTELAVFSTDITATVCISLCIRYFHHPPRYQFLHSLRNRSIKGGGSFFSDAFYAASTLRKSHPEAFALLASTSVPFHYVNDGHHLVQRHPTIELDPLDPSPSNAEIAHINYSPPFQAPLPPSTPPKFYAALKLFADLVNDPSALFNYTLKEGDAVIFDNRRVLHGRHAFSRVDVDQDEKSESPDGRVNANRWLKGCYIEADAMLDRGRVLRTKLGRDI